MRKFTGLILALIIIVIGVTVVLAQSLSATTGNPAEINVSPSILSSIKTITNKDSNIKRVDVTDDQIIIDYQETTKILGIIPAKFNLHIVTNATQKQVKLMRPWWTIFGNTRVGQLLQNIKSNLNVIDLNTTTGQDIKIIQIISNTLRK